MQEEAAKVIRPLLESVAYLHDLGIVHRYDKIFTYALWRLL